MKPHYSAIRFETDKPLLSINQDELVLRYLKEDVIEWLSGNASLLDKAKASIDSLRNEMGYTPFELAKLFNVRLIKLAELFK